MAAPGRRLIWAIWPSTQTQPSLAIQALTFWLTTRTGHGSSGVLRGGAGLGHPVSLRLATGGTGPPRPSRAPPAGAAAARCPGPDRHVD